MGRRSEVQFKVVYAKLKNVNSSLCNCSLPAGLFDDST